MTVGPDRREVVAMLASYGGRGPDSVRERVDSLDLAWLLHQVEQRYGVALDLSDDLLARMSTVSGAVEVLAEVMDPPGGSGTRSAAAVPDGVVRGTAAAARAEAREGS